MASGGFTVKGPPELPALLARLEAAKRGDVGRAAAVDAAPRLWLAVVEQSQKDGRGGNFAKGWEVEPNQGDPPGVTVRNNWPIARFVEQDTVPHKILPRPGGILAWPVGRGAFSSYLPLTAKTRANKANGGWIISIHGVNHPGTTGKDAFGITMNGPGADIVFTALMTAARTVLGG